MDAEPRGAYAEKVGAVVSGREVKVTIAPEFASVISEFTRPPMYPKQLNAIFECRDALGKPARYALIEASTKSGKTFGCLAWLIERALEGSAGRNFWWVAPVYAQARIAFRRMLRDIPIVLRIANVSEMSIKLANGAMIWFKSGEKPDNLYGDDVDAAVIDEASRLREDAWHAIRSTLTATQGPIRIIGNVKGRTNWFYLLARRGEHGEPGMAYAKITAMDAVEAGVLERSEIDDARSLLPEGVYKELYEAEASDDEGNPFGLKHIADCVVAGVSDLDPEVCGVDLGKSVNYTVILALDQNGHCAGFERFKRPWGQTTLRILDLVQHTPTLVDATGVGDPILEELTNQRSSIEGFVFTGKSKQQLLESLGMAIQNGLIRFPDGPIRRELEVFQYETTRTGVRYFAPEGHHDDCVMALALAWEMLRRTRPLIGHEGPGVVTRSSPWLSGGGEDDVFMP